MKVAFVTYFPTNPGSPRGGVEAVSVNLVKALSDFDDLNIHVVTLDDEIISPHVSSWCGTTIHRIPCKKGNILLNAIGTGRRTISAYITNLNPDVIHSHDTYGLMVKGLKFPRVFTIHGFIYGDTLVSGKKLPWLRSKIWYWFETDGWADQPHIISISPYVRERLTGIATGMIHDIDNPISESFFHVKRNEKKGTIFSAAVITPRKNTLTLIKAFTNLIASGCDAELRLAGDGGNTDYVRSINNLIMKNNLKERVIMLGRIDSEQVKKELSSASIFALVSLEENSPVGIAEAMAAGVPVVTSNRCGMPYMVRHGESGFLVNPNDPEDIALRLSQILHSDTLIKTMSDCSRAIALDRFHPARVARMTREVYIEEINKQRKLLKDIK